MTMKMSRTEIEAIAMNAKELVKKFADAEAKAKAACEAVEAMRPEVEKAVAFMVELGERAEATEKKASKMWSIVYPESAGNWRTYYLAKDINVAYGGNGAEYEVREMINAIKRGCYKELSRDEVRYIGGLLEYRGSKKSYWIDEDAVEELAGWYHDKERKVGKRNNVKKSYDEDAMVQRYKEIHSAHKVAKEFGVTYGTVYAALNRNGIRPCGNDGKKKITHELEAEIIRMYKDGLSQREIGRILGAHFTNISRVLRRNGYGKPLV